MRLKSAHLCNIKNNNNNKFGDHEKFTFNNRTDYSINIQ